MDICNIIKQARIGKGYTVKDLAFRLEINEVTLRNYESGKRYPNLDMLVKLMDVLDLELKVLKKEDIVAYNKATDIIKCTQKYFNIYYQVVGGCEEKIKGLVEKLTYLVQYETYLKEKRLNKVQI